MKYKILVVDDEPLNVRLLERIFNRDYQVLSAFSGEEALETLRQHDVALIISDHRMPEMSGIEFLKLAAEMRPRLIRIIISGYADVNVLTEAINSGVIYRFISKPWNNEDLQQTVTRALEHYEISKRQHELIRTNERLTMQMASMRRLFEQFNSDFLNIEDDASFAIHNLTAAAEVSASPESDAPEEDAATEAITVVPFENEREYANVA